MDLDMLEAFEGGSPLVRKKSYGMDVYNLYIDDVIGQPSKYRDLISALDFANHNDVVRLYINSVGGSIYTATAIVRAIQESQAHVIAIVDGVVMSAATMIMLACDDVRFGDMACGMFHTATYGVHSDTNQIKASVDFNQDALYNLLYYSYSGFLTEEEIEDMFNNSKEIWMGADEMRERWAAYVEQRSSVDEYSEEEEEE